MKGFYFSLGLLVVLTTASSTVQAQMRLRGSTLLADGSVRIHGVVLGPVSSETPDREPLALLESAAGAETIVIRTINRRTGLRLGDDLVITFPESRLAVKPVRAIFSRVLAPDSLLVLDTLLRVHEFPLDFMADGTPVISRGSSSETVLGPFGDPAVIGEGSALAEAPAAGAGMLAIGTRTGQIIAVLIGARDVQTAALALSSAPIDRLVALPQLGYFAFGAMTSGRLIGVDPGADLRPPGLQPSITFDLGSPVRFPAITDIGGPALDRFSRILARPARVPLLAANATSDVALVEIPSNPGLGGPIILDRISRLGTGIAHIAVGSFAALTADGTGVLFRPGRSSEGLEGGPTITVAGATLDFEPDTLNLRSNGRFVEATIEVENRGAAAINLASLMLQVDGVAGSLPIAADTRPHLDQDENEDGNVRLRVQFERKQLASLLRNVTGPAATLIVTWLGDGSVRGITTAAARVYVIQ